MTAATEAKLAREAELPYAAVAMVTDYDCWHEEHGPVDVASVLKVAHDNAERVEALLARVLDGLSRPSTSRARTAPTARSTARS